MRGGKKIKYLVNFVPTIVNDLFVEGVKNDLLPSYAERFLIKIQSLDRTKVIKRPFEPLHIQRGDDHPLARYGFTEARG